MSTCTDYVHAHIYIADMRMKNKIAYREHNMVSKYTVTSERKIVRRNRDYQCLSNLPLIPLVFVFWSLSVVSGSKASK